MEALPRQQERPPPPSYTSHDPDSLQLPSVPRSNPSARDAGLTLPHLSALGLPERQAANYTTSPPQDGFAMDWKADASCGLNSLALAANNCNSVGSPMSLSETSHRSVSIDDPDVRMAAEALSGLGNPDYLRSPGAAALAGHPQSTTPTRSATTRPSATPAHAQRQDDNEPLLRLLTTTHPWIGASINGSLYAYDAYKYYSPSFVRNSAEFMERNIGSPMVNTAGFVSRHTGVDGRIRRFLGHSRRRDDDRNGAGSKRRRIAAVGSPLHEEDVEQGLANNAQVESPTGSSADHKRMRTGSQSSLSVTDSLPAYDENRSPRYEELSPRAAQQAAFQTGKGSSQEPQQQQQHDPPRNWYQQTLVTTSGLGVALSQQSLRSLRYCLSVLGGASDQIGIVMRALQHLLDEFETSPASSQASSATEKQPLDVSDRESTQQQQRDDQARRLAAKVQELGDSLWSTLRQTIQAVSTYAGSALPENAAAFVRRQILSLPQRYRAASTQSRSRDGSVSSQQQQPPSAPPPTEGNADGSASSGAAAAKLVNFCKESLEMLAQCSFVVGGTVRSAEEWLDSMGRREQWQQRQQQQASEAYFDRSRADEKR